LFVGTEVGQRSSYPSRLVERPQLLKDRQRTREKLSGSGDVPGGALDAGTRRERFGQLVSRPQLFKRSHRRVEMSACDIVGH